MANIKITWTGATDNVAILGYEVSWKLSYNSTWTIVPFITTSETFGSFTLPGVGFNNTYNFRVRTRDTAQNWSTSYKTVDFTYLDTVPPTAPTDLILTPQPTSIYASWYGATDNVGIDGYELSYKLSSASTWTILPFTPDTFYSVTGLNQTTSYDFRIRSKDVGGNWSTSYTTATTTTLTSISINRSLQVDNGCGNITPQITTYSTDAFANIQVGVTKLYQDSSYSQPLVGNNNDFKIGNFTTGFKTVSVDNDGMIQFLDSCEEQIFGYQRSSTNSNSVDCGLPFSEFPPFIYFKKPLYMLTTSDFAYNNSTATTVFNGAHKYWTIVDAIGYNTITYSIHINTNGAITHIHKCDTSYEYSYSDTSYSTPGGTCAETGNESDILYCSDYYPVLGSTIYTDGSLSSPFDGNSKWYLFNIRGVSVSLLIDSDGNVMNVYNC